MLPDLSVLWVIFFVLLSVAVLNGLVFKPLLKVMHERERAIGSARELAEKAAAEARAATADFEAKTTAARAEVYREMEVARKDALSQRAALIAETRHEAETTLTAARKTLEGRRRRRPRPVEQGRGRPGHRDRRARARPARVVARGPRR